MGGTSPTVASRKGHLLVGRALGVVVMLVAACTLALWCASAGRALAEEAGQAGFVSVSGVQGVDEATQFASIADAAAAISQAAPVEGGTSVTLTVHGEVTQVDPVDLVVAEGISAVGLVGDAASSVVSTVEGDAPATLSATNASLVVRGVTFAGPVGFVSAGDLSIDACSFSGPLSVTSPGVVSVSGNSFSSASADACALGVTLTGTDQTVTVAGNEIYGYDSALRVSYADGGRRAAVSVSSNRLSLSMTTAQSAVMHLDGGPWGPSSISLDGNDIQAASCLVMLDQMFGVEDPTSANESGLPTTLMLSDPALDASGIAGIFEVIGRGTGDSSQSAVAIAADTTSFADPAVTEKAAQACAIVEGGAVAVPAEGSAPQPPAEAQDADQQAQPPAPEQAAPESQPVQTAGPFVVTYDANGASAGAAPEPSSTDESGKVSVAACGSLVKAGFEFSGWNTQADGSGTFYAVGQVFAPTADMTLYAQWNPTGTVATISVTQTTTSEAQSQDQVQNQG